MDILYIAQNIHSITYHNLEDIIIDVQDFHIISREVEVTKLSDLELFITITTNPGYISEWNRDRCTIFRLFLSFRFIALLTGGNAIPVTGWSFLRQRYMMV